MKLGILECGPSMEEMAKKYNQLHHSYIKTLTALTDAFDARDGIISSHSRRVFLYVAIMAPMQWRSLKNSGRRSNWGPCCTT
jgi:hypothetical protein